MRISYAVFCLKKEKLLFLLQTAGMMQHSILQTDVPVSYTHLGSRCAGGTEAGEEIRLSGNEDFTVWI